MGDILDLLFEQDDYEDQDGLDELRICPICKYQNCFVDVKFNVKCPKCLYDSKKHRSEL